MPCVGLLAAGSRRLKELRKWNLAPLGAVLVVVLLAAGAVAFIATGGGPSAEEQIQKYFSSTAGGAAPSEQARLIEVDECHTTYRKVRDEFVDECSLVFRGEGYTGCFLWTDDGDRIVLGSRQLASLAPGCDRLFWDASAGMLVTR
jgi:hypothetical protein